MTSGKVEKLSFRKTVRRCSEANRGLDRGGELCQRSGHYEEFGILKRLSAREAA
jgi:hypothetical protein